MSIIVSLCVSNSSPLQRYVQLILVLVAVACVPVMLCIKPFYLLAKHKKKTKVSGGVGLKEYWTAKHLLWI